MRLFQDYPWRPAFTFFYKSATDGQRIRGLVMAQRENGIKQYRAMTEDEAAANGSDEAW